jgi:hypothetical protein
MQKINKIEKLEGSPPLPEIIYKFKFLSRKNKVKIGTHQMIRIYQQSHYLIPFFLR